MQRITKACNAAETFRDAIARDPNNAPLHLGAGMAAYLGRRNADAKDALEPANPSDEMPKTSLC